MTGRVGTVRIVVGKVVGGQATVIGGRVMVTGGQIAGILVTSSPHSLILIVLGGQSCWNTDGGGGHWLITSVFGGQAMIGVRRWTVIVGLMIGPRAFTRAAWASRQP